MRTIIERIFGKVYPMSDLPVFDGIRRHTIRVTIEPLILTPEGVWVNVSHDGGPPERIIIRR